MSLHILNQSSNGTAFTEMLQALSAGDAIILIEDGVLAAMPPKAAELLATQCPLYVLEADLKARGLEGRVADEFITVDDAGFVALCCEQNKTVSWF